MNLLDPDALRVVTNVLDLAGVFASAMLGGAIARTMGFDLFGFLVVGVVSGLGGGMLRDVLLQNGPPVALTDPLYVPAAIVGVLLAFFVSISEVAWDRLFTVLDAAVIGFWAVVGVQRTFEAGLGWGPAIIMGTITAVGGGAIRDLLLRRVPAVFGGNALYASVAVAASVVMVVASAVRVPTIGIVVAVLLSVGLRVAAVRWGWGLPNSPNWQPQSALASLLRRGRGIRRPRGLRPEATRLLRRSGARPGSAHRDVVQPPTATGSFPVQDAPDGPEG
ncbi:trimeric intracellular cation channel family protein [Curtobacterium sp. RRHDQ10]|uniref:trimeric intracellular cation channel family protein n=1 Tax=Curtobacterium phyllosphaerae TaxID=3413379 RepID=UPI003BF05926